MSQHELARSAHRILEEVEKVIVGKASTVELAFIGLIAGGHILIEDIPGVGKTTLAKSLAKSIGGSFCRIQFTPDILPSDITGVNVFNQKTGDFVFRPGPVFHNIILADEVNRGTPKTQASLLECMEEFQVTVDGETRLVPRPFFVMATENPIEFHGTYPLPEAQLDRFLLRIRLGYPSKLQEISIMDSQRLHHPVTTIQSVSSAEEVLLMQSASKHIYIDDTIKGYIVDVVTRTRSHPAVQLGASPRGSLGIMRASQARAFLAQRDFVIPDDAKFVAEPVLCHRVLLKPEEAMTGLSPEGVISEILSSVPVPVVRQAPSR